MTTTRTLISVAVAFMHGAWLAAGQGPGVTVLNPDAEKWVRAAHARMSLDDEVGQLIVSSFQSDFSSGADLAIPDFRDAEALLDCIFGP